MKDIADDLNVSIVTVSKVLRGQGDISQETRNRVLKRAKELNYHPNWIARSLVTRRTYIIGLVVPDLMHSFFAEIAKGVGRCVRPRGLNVLISNSESDADLETQEVESLIARQVDGLIIASSHKSPELFRRIEKARIPYVLIDREVPGVDAHFVGVDNEEIGRIATEHLIARGYRRIAHIRAFETAVSEGRMAGYKAALARHGLEMPPGYIVSDSHGDESGQELMRRLLAIGPRPDAVFCFNDPLAAGAIAAAVEAGLRVPEDIAIIGSGNVHWSDLLTVPLSTVDQNSVALGEKAAELLLEQIEHKEPESPKRVLLPTRLVERRSTAAGAGRQR